MLTATVIISIVTAVVTYYAIKVFGKIYQIYQYRQRVNQLPGLPLLPVIGNSHQIPLPIDHRFFKLIQQNVDKFPKCFHFQISPLCATVICVHPETVKAILKTTEPKDTAGGGGYSILFPWLGNGLLLSYGQQWFRNRRLLTPAFHFDVLKPYMAIYNESSNILTEKWSKHADSGKSFNLYNDISLCTLNVIMRCAFSNEQDVQRMGNSHPYVDAVYKLAEISSNQVFNPWKQWRIFYRFTREYAEYQKVCEYVHDVADEIIAKRRKHIELIGVQDGKNRKLDFLDILLSARDEDGQGLSDLEIRNETDTFLFEGHDTTASSISWILYALAKHPDIQEKAYQEIDQLLRDREDDNIQWDDLNNMPYTTRCIKEAMRIYSPVPGIGRTLTKPMTMEGVELLPGTTVVVSFYGLHHNPAVWGEDHMQYRPDRFLPDNINKMDSHAFCPFSAGPRNCIGQNFAMYETKTLTARVLHRYRLELDTDVGITEPQPNLVTRPTNGINVRLYTRHR